MATSTIGRNVASSSSARIQKWSYDVFVSYRGEDTGKNFTDHLYSRLNGTGIATFRDKNELKRGKRVSSELLEAIRGSNICIIVFSRNYATSTWCLDELVEIMKCQKRKHVCQTVIPIFYKVKASDVRKQTGSFEEAFVKHDDQEVGKDKVSSWRAALAEAGELSGWDLNDTDGYEGEFIKKIVEKISNVLNHTYLHLAIHPVGIDTRRDYMNSLLTVGTNDVRMVAICGMAGIGKTTIAKAVFNHFFHSFEFKSFLANVGENSKQNKKSIRLQEQLLSDILKTEVRDVQNVDRGIEVIKRRLCNKRVLIVLDDVDQLDQIIAFNCHSKRARKDCFGPGSRIIITTKHEHLLERIDVNDVYTIKEMDDNESLELFSWHAFERSDPVEGYDQLSKDVVGYSKGLPLALEVLGSYLREFKSIAEWKNALQKLKRTPHGKIQEKLRISFDSLDRYEKKIFLDIACFFIGMNKHYVTKVLDGCNFFATSGIGVLTRRCLVTINESKNLMMHDLLRNMGREIVCQESEDNPEQRSRLWHREDVLDVLTNCTGTVKIEGLALNMDGFTKIDFGAKTFDSIKNLRLLQLSNVSITGDYEGLSKKLRWLCWHGFPLSSIPENFYQENLVLLDMQYSNLRQVWTGNKVLEMLKILDLSHSHLLIRITTDFSRLPNLEELILADCTGLETIDESIGSLSKLWFLNLRDCTNLTNLPKSITMVKSLVVLLLDGCLKFDKLPEEIGEIESLHMLSADKTAVGQLPDSVVHLKHLTFLSLTRVSLEDCNLSQGAIPNDIGNLSSLEFLALCDNNFYSVPASIGRLSKLESLLVDGCTNLVSLPVLPSSLTFLSARRSSLEILPDLSNFTHAITMNLTDCNKLATFPFTESLLETWYATYNGTIFDDIVFPWSEIPDWFRNQRIGNVLTVKVPPNMSFMKGFVLCVIYAARNFEIGDRHIYEILIGSLTEGWCTTISRGAFFPPDATPHEHLTIGYVPIRDFDVQGGHKLVIEIITRCEKIVKCGVIPVYIKAKKGTKIGIEEEVSEFKSLYGEEGATTVLPDDLEEEVDEFKYLYGEEGATIVLPEDLEEEVNEFEALHGEKSTMVVHADEKAVPSHHWSISEEHSPPTSEMMFATNESYLRRYGNYLAI